ncbi:ABC transporter substrate-binding protein [Alicyclobacillus sp. ALC3]|uniref:ABC transporter substrate-binding protein n=1 Tax=Alicyclobacillus sp. ALC3 TaxID=2796143 RepID=UPI002379B5B9|nr:ABC transporter substrate-binding protein [Alicyclobacillus sp. ALC3]
MKRVWVAAVVLAGTMAVVGCGTGATGQSTGNTASTATSTNSTSASQSSVSYPLTVKDQVGHSVTIPKQPVHIASTTEGTDEILTGLVPKKDIALVTAQASQPNFSNVASLVKGIPSMGAVSAEQVIAVHPDLVLMASYNQSGVVQQIEQAGSPVYEFANFNSMSEIEQNINILGKLVGEPTKAAQMVQMMQRKIGAVQKAVRGLPKPTVLDYGSYGYAAGNGTTIQNIITDAGGVNAAAKLNGWSAITTEEVVKLNPDVIIDTTDDAAFKQKLLSDPALQSVNAIKNHRVYILSGADLGSVSQYIYRAVEDVARVLHPHANVPTN